MGEKNPGIHPELTIQEILERYPVVFKYFRNQYFGYEFPGDFNCLECPMAGQETLGEAARSHGIEVEHLIQELNHLMDKEYS